LQESRQGRPGCIHGHGRRLHDRRIGVAVDEETGQAIGLTVNQRKASRSSASRRRQASAACKRSVTRAISSGKGALSLRRSKHAQGDWRQSGPCRAGERPSSFVEHSHQSRPALARIGRGPGEHVLPKDPGMPRDDARAARAFTTTVGMAGSRTLG